MTPNPPTAKGDVLKIMEALRVSVLRCLNLRSTIQRAQQKALTQKELRHLLTLEQTTDLCNIDFHKYILKMVESIETSKQTRT